MVNVTSQGFIFFSALALFMAALVGWLWCDVWARKRAKEKSEDVGRTVDGLKHRIDTLRGMIIDVEAERNRASSDLARTNSDLADCKSLAANAQKREFEALAKVRLWTDRPKVRGKYISREQANAIVAESEIVDIKDNAMTVIQLPAQPVATGGGVASAFGEGATE